MKMKRILSLLLALVMVFALAACGSTDTPAPGTSGGDVKQPARGHRAHSYASR